MIGTYRHLASLDVPNGSNGYLPLNPVTWPCGILNESLGTVTFIGRFHPGLTTPNARVHFQGRIFHVDTVTNREGRNVELEVTCREVFDGDQA